MVNLEGIAEAIVAGNANQVQELTKKAIDAGIDPRKILAEGLQAGMEIVGLQWKKGRFFIPEVLLAAKAMQAGTELLRPLFVGEVPTSLGKIVIGTVKGDIHEIGKNMVAMMLEGAGFQVQDLGVNVSPETFVKAVREGRPRILGMSALLSTTAPSISDTIRTLNEAGIRDQVKVLVGGAIVTPSFANSIGADGYAPDAARAVEVAKSLVA